MGAVLHFTRRERVEVIEAFDHDRRRLWIFELVGADKFGVFRVDIAHRYTAEDARRDIVDLRREGLSVEGAMP